jgi:predicted Zn-dependent protease
MRLRSIAVVLAFGSCCSFALSQAHQSAAGALVQPERPAAKYKHGIKDLDAIGIRNVGCDRGFSNWYSIDRQVEMGQAYAHRVEAGAKLITDPEVTEYINRIGQNLVRNSDAHVAFTIKVIDSDEVNAMALPGGFFYIDSGLILATDTEAELAGIMAHEIAHVAACHVARGRTRGQLFGLATLSLTMVGGPVAYAAYEGLTASRPFALLKFSRKFESEADFLGVQYMYRAGYDPQALPAFFERVRAMQKQSEGAIARAFSTHPQTADRIGRTQAEINDLLPARSEYIVDTSEFQDVKARVNQLQGRTRLKNQSGPVLRRVSHREPDSSERE